jgi:hypothetical protein
LIQIRSDALDCSGRQSDRTVMLTTLLVIAACLAAGTVVSRFHPEYRKW